MGKSLPNYLERSNQLMVEGDWSGQAALMKDAVLAFPQEPELRIRLALAIYDEEPERAAHHANEAAELASTDPGMLARCASLLFDLEHFDDASRYVKQLVPLAPDDFPLIPDILHLAGKLAMRKGNSDVAERYLAKAFEVDPSTAGHALVLAQFLSSQGRYDDALDILSRGLEHAPSDREALLEIRREIKGEI